MRDGRFLEHLPGAFHVRAFQADHHWNLEADLLGGLDHSTIARQQHRTRDLIDAEITALIDAGLTASRRTAVRFAEYGSSPACIPGESDTAWAKISLDASKSILSLIAGAPNTIINNIIYAASTHEVPEFIHKLMGSVQGRDMVVDVEVEDE